MRNKTNLQIFLGQIKNILFYVCNGCQLISRIFTPSRVQGNLLIYVKSKHYINTKKNLSNDSNNNHFYPEFIFFINCWQQTKSIFCFYRPDAQRNESANLFKPNTKIIFCICRLYGLKKCLLIVFPHIVSSLEYFPPLNSFPTLVRKLFKFSLHKRKANAETIWIFQNFTISKKNSCRGNYMRKYGSLKVRFF